MQNIRIEHFNEGDVITALLPSGEYVAFEQAREIIRGHGHSRWAAIADLNRAIEAAGEDRDEEDDDHPLTGQDRIEAGWDHARASRDEVA